MSNGTVALVALMVAMSLSPPLHHDIMTRRRKMESKVYIDIGNIS